MTPVAQMAAHAPSAGRRLWRELRLVQRLLEEHRAAAVGRFGSAALEVIDLPPIAPTGELDASQIRAAGALLWAREVEGAGLPSFVDALAEGVLEGKVLLDITTAADRLMLYRRQRTQRFSAEERAAIYGRIFDAQFDEAWNRLLSALDAIARAAPNQNLTAPTARAVAAARDVAFQLSQRSGGIAPFAARSILEHVRDAFSVLRDPDLVRALGGATPWQMIRLHAMEVLGRQLDPVPSLDRAAAALRICGWLGDAAGPIEAGAPHLPPPDALDAAELWLASRSVS